MYNQNNFSNLNKDNDIMYNIKELPDDIKKYIFDFLPNNKVKYLNKTLYNLTYPKIIPLYLNISYEIYIRKIITNDYEFIFKVLINNNLNRWIAMKKYIYERMIFKNYIHFLNYFAQEKNSKKCLKLINQIIENSGLNIKQHKNIIKRNIIWIK